ncbi:hypothetical protein [Arthrobacter globiformis]|uniref:hypothetical protein n=1 Tax=Arthrobacter globiformis TaxID=1665 RepID=UPI00279293F4|nr:hypothetical protein [Arthrobacter globiformis]MDQ0616470.1 hypothetical protein [Arthrobacter globiformis]
MGRQDTPNSGAGRNRSPKPAAQTTAAGKTAPRAGRKPSPAVYRRRRLFAGVALLLVLGLIGGGVATVTSLLGGAQQVSAEDSTQGSSTQGTGAAQPGATPSSSPSATPSASPTCEQKLVTVKAATNKTSYAADEKPVLSLTVTNGGKLPCKVNIGTSQMDFLITSGSDRVFSSADCQAATTDLVKTIAPGKSETANFPWPRNRSVQGCGQVPDGSVAGSGYYVFIAKLGAKVSPPTVFQLS